MIDVVVPMWGLTMDEAVLVTWFKQVGDAVVEGEPIAEIETDKTQSELESPASGILREASVVEGESVEPGQVIGRIEQTPG